MPKGILETINRREKYNIKEKGRAIMYKKLHRKLKKNR
jgi:hypothetical protein